MNTTLRTLVGRGIALAAVVAAPVAAQADTPAAPVVSSASQIVVRDADSGRLRAATAEEAEALQSSHARSLVARRGAPTVTQAKAHVSGARGARLTDEFMSYSVLVRQPDGRLAEFCFNSREEAEAAVASGVAAPVSDTLPTE